MATNRIKLQGKAKWARVFENNRDMEGFEGNYRPYNGAYTIQLEMDKENFDKLEATGAAKASKARRKEVDRLGSVEIKFERKHNDRFEWASGAPKVYKKDGSEWSFSDDGLIGNDSDVELEISVYTTSKATGTRLESVLVLNPVEYNEFTKDHSSSPAISEEVPF